MPAGTIAASRLVMLTITLRSSSRVDSAAQSIGIHLLSLVAGALPPVGCNPYSTSLHTRMHCRQASSQVCIQTPDATSDRHDKTHFGNDQRKSILP